MPKLSLFKYQQVLLFIGVGVLLWAAIFLQLFAHETPCPRCWEIRGVYLIILQLLMFSMLLGYKELLSIVVIGLFIIIGNYITVEQLIRHTINVTQGSPSMPGYGGYADFLDISLSYWNLMIANAAIIYICAMNYISHRYNVVQYTCSSQLSRCVIVFWAQAPLLVNAVLFARHLMS